MTGQAFGFPVMLDVRGRRCVVLGGGEVAERRVRALLDAGASVTVVCERAVDGISALAGAGHVTLVARRYAYGDLAAAAVALAATDDASVSREAFKEAEERGVLFNAADDVEHCHFAVPAVVRHGDFTLTVATGGKAPALAKSVRRELSSRFGPEYGEAVDLLGEVREELPRGPEVAFDDWAARWERALAAGVLDLVRAGRAGEARERVRRALLGGEDVPAAAGGGSEARGRVSIVGAGPGDPGLISVRGRELLESADVVVHDRLVDPSLVEGRDAIFVGKEPGRHSAEQSEINDLLVRLAGEGRHVVRLKGGDPFLFGRGAEEAEALAGAGIEFEIVPAPTSAIAALAYAGIPVTDRRHASSVAIVAGHCNDGAGPDWHALATAADTIVILMGVRRLAEIVAALVEGGRDPATPAAVVENGATPSQRVVTAALGDLPAAVRKAGVEPPAVVVVGDVVRLRERIDWYSPAAASGRRRD